MPIPAILADLFDRFHARPPRGTPTVRNADRKRGSDRNKYGVHDGFRSRNAIATAKRRQAVERAR